LELTRIKPLTSEHQLRSAFHEASVFEIEQEKTAKKQPSLQNFQVTFTL